MAEREICCCGAGGWTKVIAWLQIVVNALALIAYVIILNFIVQLSPKDFKKAMKGAVLSSAGDSAYAISVAILVVSIPIASFAVMMAVVLLKGSKQRNAGYLRLWIVYTIICMVWDVISKILNTTFGLGVSLVFLIFMLTMYFFGIWVVLVHVKEIKSQHAPAAYGGRSQYGKGP